VKERVRERERERERKADWPIKNGVKTAWNGFLARNNQFGQNTSVAWELASKSLSWLITSFQGSLTRGDKLITFIDKIYRFVRTSQETHYVSATSPTG
jgi:hypothetical protein